MSKSTFSRIIFSLTKSSRSTFTLVSHTFDKKNAERTSFLVRKRFLLTWLAPFRLLNLIYIWTLCNNKKVEIWSRYTQKNSYCRSHWSALNLSNSYQYILELWIVNLKTRIIQLISFSIIVIFYSKTQSYNVFVKFKSWIDVFL